MSQSAPKVSIIITTYNRYELLKRAIQSVLNQTYQDFELIIVDDASTDNTQNYFSSFKHPQIHYIRNAKNQKLPISRNIGIEVAQGEYIGFLDDDDEIHPDKLERQVQYFNSADAKVGVIYCGWQNIFENKIVSKCIPKYEGNLFKKFLGNNFLYPHTLLIKKECFQKAGVFDPNLESSEDWDMWIRIARYYHFERVNHILVSIHIHNVNKMSFHLKDKVSARKKIMNKFQEDLHKDSYAFSTQLGRLGALCCLNNQIEEGYSLIMKAVRLAPFRIKNYLYIVLLFLDKFIPGIYEKVIIEKVGPIKLYF